MIQAEAFESFVTTPTRVIYLSMEQVNNLNERKLYKPILQNTKYRAKNTNNLTYLPRTKNV